MEFDSVGKSSQIRPRINPPFMPIAEDQLQAIALRVQVIELHSQGYGLQLVFSDGHERGIYPWAYLAGLID